MPVANIAEADASAALAELYSEIRESQRAPAVSLIWRHLATVDGALPWAWKALKPLLLDPELEREAAALREFALARARASGLVPWPDSELSDARVGSEDLATIHRVLSSYHHSNPRNLIAFVTLLGEMTRSGEKGVSRHRAKPAESPDSEMALPLPALIAPERMGPAVRGFAMRLEALGRRSPPDEIVAGVPRHLARWPGFLGLAVEALASVEPSLRDAIAVIDATAARSADRVELGERGSAPPDFAPFVISAVRRFVSPDMIAGYIGKVAFILAKLPEPRREGPHRTSPSSTAV